MNVRQVEQLVSAHARGDRPTDGRNPELEIKKVTFEVRAGTDARLRQVRQVLAAEQDGATIAMATRAKQALKQLGFKQAEAARYVDHALAMAPTTPDLEGLIRTALRCSRTDE